MAASPTTLLSRLEGVYDRVARRERPVMARVLAWKKRGKEGDKRAAIAYNTLAVIHWKRRNPTLFRKSEIFYNRLMAREPAASHIFRESILPRAKSGDMNARRVYASLKAVHHRRKASVWTMGPGSPQIGYHPLPQQHRVGIEFSPQGTNMFSYAQIQQLGTLIQSALASTLVPGMPIPPSFPWLSGFPIPPIPWLSALPGLYAPQLMERSYMPMFDEQAGQAETPQLSAPSSTPFGGGARATSTATRSTIPTTTSVATALRSPSVTRYYSAALRPLR